VYLPLLLHVPALGSMRSGPLPDWKQKVPPVKSASLLLRYSTALKWRCARYSLEGSWQQSEQQQPQPPQEQVQCQMVKAASKSAGRSSKPLLFFIGYAN
jgi:hypothetical protein